MEINKNNFTSAKLDVFSLFNDRWALATAGTPEDFNTMTIGWGTMGTIWGPPKGGKQIIEVFLRENRCTADVLLRNEYLPSVSSRRKSGRIWGFWAANPAGMSPTRSTKRL